MERKCISANLTANGSILHPGFLRAGGQEGGFWQKIISFPSSAPWTWDSSSAPLQWTTFFFFPQLSLAKCAEIRTSQGNPPRITPRSGPSCGVFPSENQSSTEKEENNLPQAKQPGEAAFILDPSSVLPRKQTLGLRSREARAESLPQHLAHPSTRAGERSRACPTYLVPAASSPDASSAGRSAAGRRGSLGSRARPRETPPPQPPVPRRSRPSPRRPPASRHRRCAPGCCGRCWRQASGVCASAAPARARGRGERGGREGRGAGGRGGERGGAANGVPRLAPPAYPPPPTRASAPLRPAGPRVALRSGSVRPRAFGLRRALGAVPEGCGGQRITAGWPCARTVGPRGARVKGRSSTSRKTSYSCSPTSAQRWAILVLKPVFIKGTLRTR